MKTFAIESNGRIDNTIIYINGEQIAGVKEIFININEDGLFDAIIQYEGIDKNIYTKNIFEDYLTNIKTTEPYLTEEEAQALRQLIIESDGNIENTTVLIDDEIQTGIVSLFIHIKASSNKNGIRSFFKAKTYIPETIEFRAEITYRNEDNSLETEEIF